MTNSKPPKNYSHIRPGMYVLSDEIKDEETYIKVRDAFLQAGAPASIDSSEHVVSVNRNYDHFKAARAFCCSYYGWGLDLWNAPTGLLYLYDNVAYFGKDTALEVSIDFILNGSEDSVQSEESAHQLGQVFPVFKVAYTLYVEEIVEARDHDAAHAIIKSTVEDANILFTQKIKEPVRIVKDSNRE